MTQSRMLNGRKESGDHWTKEVEFLSTRRAMNQSWRYVTLQRPTLGYTDVLPLTNMVKLRVMSTYRWTKGRNRRRLKVTSVPCWRSKSAQNCDRDFCLTRGPREAWASYCKTQSTRECDMAQEWVTSGFVLEWCWETKNETHPKACKQKEVAR